MKITASRTLPGSPNSADTIRVSTAAPLADASPGNAPPDRAPTWASMAYTASSMTPAMHPAFTVPRTTA